MRFDRHIAAFLGKFDTQRMRRRRGAEGRQQQCRETGQNPFHGNLANDEASAAMFSCRRHRVNSETRIGFHRIPIAFLINV
jgi:hypothetical protein